MASKREEVERQLRQLKTATERRREQLQGWPTIPPYAEREEFFARRLKGARYDDPGQTIIRFKGDRK